MMTTEKQQMVMWTRDKLEAFKKAHASAIGELFEFEGVKYVRTYAGFLIQYLEKQFK